MALVIGNAKYKWEASLPNVKRDAPDVAKRFQALGLKTELVQDAGLNAMRAAVDRFTAAARGANLAAFYYAGHGASWNKDTYLVPEDADLSNPGTVQGLQPVSAISAAVKEAQHRLLVFDNCRNNPADGWRQRDALIQAKIDSTDSVAAGLHAPSTLLLSSTSSGRTALDGAAGENSPFAAAFLRQLGGATVDIQALPANLRRDLLIATQGRQLLWDQNTYSEPFVLSELSNRPPASPRETPATSLGPGGYQARIVEVPNAYASARENKLPLPPGLLCCRPPDGSPHSEKIGAFKWPLKVRGAVFPTVGIIMSVSENTAEAVVSTYTEIGGWGVRWR
ncbi:MAG: caspase family protein, partial [Enhydrobacter sp.]